MSQQPDVPSKYLNRAGYSAFEIILFELHQTSRKAKRSAERAIQLPTEWLLIGTRLAARIFALFATADITHHYLILTPVMEIYVSDYAHVVNSHYGSTVEADTKRTNMLNYNHGGDVSYDVLLPSPSGPLLLVPTQDCSRELRNKVCILCSPAVSTSQNIYYIIQDDHTKYFVVIVTYTTQQVDD